MAKTYSVMVTSTWTNGRPTPEETVSQTDFLTVMSPLAKQGLVSASIWPDENTTIRYFINEASAQLYISTVTDLNLKLNRNDWSYAMSMGSITLSWSLDNNQSTQVCESPWVPAV
jgi:hypothetical protein